METKSLEVTLGYGTSDAWLQFHGDGDCTGAQLGSLQGRPGPGWPLKPRTSTDKRVLTAIKKGFVSP